MKKIVLILAALMLLPTLAMGVDLSAQLNGDEGTKQGFVSISTLGQTMSYTVMLNGVSADHVVLMSGDTEVVDFGATFNGGFAVGGVNADPTAVVNNPSAFSIVVESAEGNLVGAVKVAGGLTGLQSDVPRRNYGEVAVGVTAPRRKVVMTNNNESGNVKINFAGVFGPNKAQYFLALNECDGATLRPGQSCRIFIDFTPAALGTQKALLQVLSNDAENPEIRIQLRGDGI